MISPVTFTHPKPDLDTQTFVVTWVPWWTHNPEELLQTVCEKNSYVPYSETFAKTVLIDPPLLAVNPTTIKITTITIINIKIITTVYYKNGHFSIKRQHFTV